MNFTRNQFIKNIFMLIAVGGFAFFFRGSIQTSFKQAKNYYFPCKGALSYSIGSFDERFGISRIEFLKVLGEAESIWEVADRELFVYEPETLADDIFIAKGDLKINLIYDARQNATITLQNMGLTLKNNKSSYDILKRKYDTFQQEFIKEKKSFQYNLSAIQELQNKYDRDVNYWNSRGGAPEEIYAQLNAESISINKKINAINEMQIKLNTKANNINSLAIALNRLVTSLHLDVKRFNEIGEEYGGEFEEGTYESGPNGARINIYQFEDREKLVRVLAHEFGHALGLEHIDEPKAIMYRLNNGVNPALTEDDLIELNKKCGLY